MLDFIFDQSEFIPTKKELSFFLNKTILITGAAGSIGSALTKVLSKIKCKLILLDHSEYLLYKLRQGFNENPNFIFYLGDITDEEIVKNIFKSFQPNVVYHIAAYKHVAFTQAHPFSAFKTNTYATKLIAKYAALNQTEHCILISTDKAVNPINVLGQSKYLAEEIFKNYFENYKKTVFKIIRLGNIPYSTGSILPLFQSNLSDNKKIEIRNINSARYFIKMKDVVRHLLSLPKLKNNVLFIPEMGNLIKIKDIADALISRIDPNKKNKSVIDFIELLPGEKLIEEYASNEEHFIQSYGDLKNYSSQKKIEMKKINDFIAHISPQITAEETNSYFLKFDLSKP